jgi:hypothetical protein
MGMNSRWKRWLATLATFALTLAAVPGQGALATPTVEDSVRATLQARAEALLPNGDIDGISQHYDRAHTQGSQVVGGKLLAYEQQKIREFHTWAANRNIRLLDIKVTLNFEQVQVTGTLAKVRVIEGLAMNWVYKDKPDQVTMTGLGITHEMDLALVGNRWVLQRDDYQDPFQQSLGPDHSSLHSHESDLSASSLTAGSSSTSNVGSPETAGTMSTAYYERAQAAAYADKYCGTAPGCGNAGKYNDAKYAKASDDCTNFVSQALGDPTEGGLAPQDPGHTYSTDWYYDYPTKTGSLAWVRASCLVTYLYNHPRGSTYNKGYLFASGSYGSVSNPTSQYPKGPVWELYRGDVIGYDWSANGSIDHTAVVAAYDPQGYPLMDAHNSDQYHAWWDLGKHSPVLSDSYEPNHLRALAHLHESLRLEFSLA